MHISAQARAYLDGFGIILLQGFLTERCLHKKKKICNAFLIEKQRFSLSRTMRTALFAVQQILRKIKLHQ